MKRDLDLIRHILLTLEKRKDADLIMAGVFLNDKWTDVKEINFHLTLLIEAGYIDGSSKPLKGDFFVTATHITWEGYEFLDDARDDKRWKKAQEAVGQAGGVALEVLKKVLAEMAGQAVRASLGLPPR